MKRTLAFKGATAVVLAAWMAVTSCATISAGQSATVVRSEQAETSAFTLADAFVKLEYNQVAAGHPLELLLPGIHAASNKVRANGPKAIREVHRLIDVYAVTKASSTPDLDTALLVLSQLVTDLETWNTSAARHARMSTAAIPVLEIVGLIQTLIQIYNSEKAAAAQSAAASAAERAATATTEEAAFASLAWQVQP